MTGGAGTAGGPLLEVRGLGVRYGRDQALHDVDLDVRRGEMLAVIGPNGAGKSSLLRSLAGLVEHSGQVTWHSGCDHDPPTVRIAYVAQRAAPRWELPLTVRQAVALGRIEPRRWWRRPARVHGIAVDAALDRMSLSGLSSRPVGHLSGGQSQRVLLARALAQDPDVLLLDEPFEGLDATSTRSLLETLTELSTEGPTVCCVVHALDVVEQWFPRAVAVRGRVVADGPAPQVLSPQGLETLFGIGAAGAGRAA